MATFIEKFVISKWSTLIGWIVLDNPTDYISKGLMREIVDCVMTHYSEDIELNEIYLTEYDEINIAVIANSNEYHKSYAEPKTINTLLKENLLQKKKYTDYISTQFNSLVDCKNWLQTTFSIMGWEMFNTFPLQSGIQDDMFIRAFYNACLYASNGHNQNVIPTAEMIFSIYEKIKKRNGI